MFTGAGGLKEPVVYRSWWFTGAGGLQEPVVYRCYFIHTTCHITIDNLSGFSLHYQNIFNLFTFLLYYSIYCKRGNYNEVLFIAFITSCSATPKLSF